MPPRARAAKTPKERVAWTGADKARLLRAREEHSSLSWKQFHQLKLFPGRSLMGLYCEWRHLESLQDPVKGTTEAEVADTDDDPASSDVALASKHRDSPNIGLRRSSERLAKRPRVGVDESKGRSRNASTATAGATVDKRKDKDGITEGYSIRHSTDNENEGNKVNQDTEDTVDDAGDIIPSGRVLRVSGKPNPSKRWRVCYLYHTDFSSIFSSNRPRGHPCKGPLSATFPIQLLTRCER
ncbi:uncharacterized protein BDV17DRAFT_250599 [Aspergillus undulatus]|uniref:uncharacterized protein n=1 Tax=Aspergillus undulatus TaxID=1810928 RepID=UPI003CCCEA0D